MRRSSEGNWKCHKSRALLFGCFNKFNLLLIRSGWGEIDVRQKCWDLHCLSSAAVSRYNSLNILTEMMNGKQASSSSEELKQFKFNCSTSKKKRCFWAAKKVSLCTNIFNPITPRHHRITTIIIFLNTKHTTQHSQGARKKKNTANNETSSSADKWKTSPP